MKEVNVGDFVTVKDSSFADYGVKKGDLIYLAGDAIVSRDEKDPYNLRRIFVAAYTHDGHVLPERKPFMVDGKRLTPVSKAKQEKLKGLMEYDFEEREEDDTTH
ncbi:hypothetical protein N9924_00570 [bacterium]|nr:hypothetical protein [bacterium]